jgi:hypothetical protein
VFIPDRPKVARKAPDESDPELGSVQELIQDFVFKYAEISGAPMNSDMAAKIAYELAKVLPDFLTDAGRWYRAIHS